MTQSQTVSRLPATVRRAEILIDACSACVQQCLDIVQHLPAETYGRSTIDHSPIGTHMRHIIERIACVLDGLESGLVDYDHRARDFEMASDPQTAVRALTRIQKALACLGPGCSPVLRVSESVHEDQPAVTVDSSLERELMSLVSHTIHHLAIITMLARSLGHPLADHIGKAPSTIIYERSVS